MKIPKTALLLVFIFIFAGGLSAQNKYPIILAKKNYVGIRLPDDCIIDIGNELQAIRIIDGQQILLAKTRVIKITEKFIVVKVIEKYSQNNIQRGDFLLSQKSNDLANMLSDKFILQSTKDNQRLTAESPAPNRPTTEKDTTLTSAKQPGSQIANSVKTAVADTSKSSTQKENKALKKGAPRFWIGGTGGANFNTIANTKKQYKYHDNLPKAFLSGYSVGGIIEVRLVGPLSICATPLYSTTTKNWDVVIYDYGSVKNMIISKQLFRYFEIPLNLKYKSGLLIFSGGASYNIRAASSETQYYNNDGLHHVHRENIYNIKHYYFAYNCGIGFSFNFSKRINLTLESRFTFEQDKIFDKPVINFKRLGAGDVKLVAGLMIGI